MPCKGYVCPVCYADFETSDQKVKHLEWIHGYEQLDVTPQVERIHGYDTLDVTPHLRPIKSK